MKIRFFNSYSLVSLGVVVNLLAYPSLVLGNTLNYHIRVDINSGPLAPNNYSATLSFDDSTLQGIGSETLGISSFNFSFQGTTYTQDDDTSATVEFFDGNFLGLNYAVFATPSPTFAGGFLGISDASFSYDLGGLNQGGTGVLIYNLQTTTTNEPSALVSLLMMSGIMMSGILVATRRKSSSK
jgi:hypothetical protein